MWPLIQVTAIKVAKWCELKAPWWRIRKIRLLWVLTQLANMFEVYPHLNNIREQLNQVLFRINVIVVEKWATKAMTAKLTQWGYHCKCVMSLMNDKELVEAGLRNNLEGHYKKFLQFPHKWITKRKDSIVNPISKNLFKPFLKLTRIKEMVIDIADVR